MQLKELLQAMKSIGHKLGISTPMICGGVARAKAMGQLNDISDLDITTGDKSIEYLSKELGIFLAKYYSFKIKQMADGHTSIFLGNLKLDFSSNFLAPNIDAILAKMGVKKPTALEKEMYSRDFTCNALLMTLDLKEILDPTGRGIEDIKKRVIRTCLDPEITLTINKNRVVRAIYLAAKLDFDLDPAIVKWVKAHPESIKLASEHTLVEKLNKAMELSSTRTINCLDQMNLWSQIPISEALYPYYIKRQSALIQMSLKVAEQDLNHLTDPYETTSLQIPFPPAEVSPIGMLDGIYPQADLEGVPLGSLYYGQSSEHYFADDQNAAKIEQYPTPRQRRHERHDDIKARIDEIRQDYKDDPKFADELLELEQELESIRTELEKTPENRRRIINQ